VEVDWVARHKQFIELIDRYRNPNGSNYDCIVPVSGGIGLLYALPFEVEARINGQYVERAPDAAELFSKGMHEATGTFEIGNPDLEKEKAATIETGFKKSNGPFRFDAAAYYTRYYGFIYRQLTGVECGTTLVECGAPSGDETFNQVFFQQRDATFYGTELSAQLDVGRVWNGIWGIDGQYDFVRAKFEDGENVPRIPPHRLGGGLYYHDANWLARVGLLHAFEQDQIGAEELVTPGYTLVNGIPILTGNVCDAACQYNACITTGGTALSCSGTGGTCVPTAANNYCGTGGSGSCAAGMYWDGTTCVASTTTCVAPMVWDGISCVAQTVGSCVAPMVWDAATSTCIGSTTTCGAGMYWDGYVCVASTNTCVAPMVWDGIACKDPATCISPMVWNGTSCVAQTVGSCVAPMVWDAATSTCIGSTTTCGAGMYWDGTTCVASTTTCTAPMIPDGAGGCMNDPNVCTAPTAANNFCGAGQQTCAAGEVPDGYGGCMVDPNACAPTSANNYCVTCAYPATPDGNGNCTAPSTCTPGPENNYYCPPALAGTIPLGTPGFAADPEPGKMYDAFGAQMPIPSAGYRHVGYAHSLPGVASMDMALNEATAVSSAPGGAVTSFEAPSVNAAAVSSANQFTVGIGNATQMDFGTDPVSGMSWGRWQGNWVTSNPTQGIVPVVSGGNLHWFALPTQTQAITLPITGTISYTYAGSTRPTDNHGTQGTLTSATLNANFTAQQVNVSVGVSMPASAGAAAVQMNAAANNVPILPGANFKATNPTVTCTGCAAAATGVIGGQFSQGGMGAGVGYGLQNGTQVINGAAVFHR